MLHKTPPDVNIIVVCHSGNHGRMTKHQRIATEAGNSLEQYMYLTIRFFFKDETRISFLVAHRYTRICGFLKTGIASGFITDTRLTTKAGSGE